MTRPIDFGRLTLWSRVWPYMMAIACGLLVGLAIFVARWL